MYAKMWKEDYLSKCQREVVEEALQIERNKEMLEVCMNTIFFCFLYACVSLIKKKLHCVIMPYLFCSQLLNVHMAAKQKEQEELRILREKEAELLVSFQ